MNIKKIILLIACSISIFLSACATIVDGGGEQVINIDSDPQGAKIFLAKEKDGELVDVVDTGDVTPKSVTVSKKKIVMILKKEGYEDARVGLQSTMNPWFLGNIIIGGLLGSSIDSSTGAINEYDPGSYMVEMKKIAE